MGCDDAGRERSWRLRGLEVRVSADTRDVFMLILRAHKKRLGKIFAAKSLLRGKDGLGSYTIDIALGYHFYSQIYTSLKTRLNSSESICVMSNQHFHV